MTEGVSFVLDRSRLLASSAKQLRPFLNQRLISSMTVVSVKDARWLRSDSNTLTMIV